jgi:hypothetical protein
MSSIRPPAEEGALVPSLLAAAQRVCATLDIGPWRDVAALPLVSLETCFGGGRARHGRRTGGAAGARAAEAG